jgi:hypothetical protein
MAGLRITRRGVVWRCIYRGGLTGHGFDLGMVRPLCVDFCVG